MEKRIPYYDAIKAVAVVLMVFGHIYDNGFIHRWIYSFHMPIFYMVGGMLYKRRDIIEDLTTRFKTIMIPFYFWGLLTALYGLLFEYRFRDTEYTPISCMRGLAFGLFDDLNFNIVLWFLPAYFFAMVLFNIILTKTGNMVIGLISIICALGYSFVAIPSLPYCIDQSFKFFPFITLGYFIKEYGHANKKLDLSFGNNKILIFVALSMSICGNWLLDYNILFVAWYFLGIIGSVLVLAVSHYLNNNMLLKIGRGSLIVCCIHGPIYRPVLYIISRITKCSTELIRLNYILATICTMITIAICIAIKEFLIKVRFPRNLI